MASSFTISRYQAGNQSNASLRDEIHRHTGNDAETVSILRCIERFGDDTSIGGWEVSPKPHRGTRHPSRAVAWTVRALRK